MKKIVLLYAGLFFFAAVNAQEPATLQVNRLKTTDRTVDSLRKFIMGKDSSAKKPPAKKPYSKAATKPANKTKAKRDD